MTLRRFPGLPSAPAPALREELLAPYKAPYRTVLDETWRRNRELRAATAVAPVMGASAVVGLLADRPAAALLCGVVAVVAVGIVLLWLQAVLTAGRRLTRAWDVPTDLAHVRATRPHAGLEPAEVAHEEFGVSVEGDGRLVTWCFRPLAVHEHPRDDEVEVPGRPRYGARPADDRPYDPQDTVLATEQLVAAQAAASAREAGAIQAATEATERSRALLEEGTFTALRHAARQPPRAD